MALTETEKKAVVDSLISDNEINGVSPWTEEDRPALNAMPEEKLLILEKQRKEIKNNAAVAKAALTGFSAGQPGEYTYNAATGAFEKKEAPKPAPTNNEQKKAQTADEWLAEAPKEVQDVVRNAMAAEEARVNEAVTAILEDASTGLTENQLRSMEKDTLYALATSVTQRKADAAKQPKFFNTPPTANKQPVKESPLVPPVLTFEKSA